MQNIKRESMSYRSSYHGYGFNNFEIDWGLVRTLCPGANIIEYKKNVDNLDINRTVSFFINKIEKVFEKKYIFNKE